MGVGLLIAGGGTSGGVGRIGAGDIAFAHCLILGSGLLSLSRGSLGGGGGGGGCCRWAPSSELCNGPTLTTVL